MRILHVEASSGWGGQEIRILRESLGMRSRGHEVVLAVQKGGGLVSRAREKGFLVYEVDFRKRKWIVSFFRLLQIMIGNHIDILNTHSSEDSWLGGMIARVLRIPIIRTRHLSTAIRPGLNSVFLYNHLADFVVATCKAVLPVICLQAKKSPHECLSVPTGVDPTALVVSKEEVFEFRKKLEISPEDFLVGTSCFMRSWKGIDDFLQAAFLLRDQPHLKWVIVGGGHEERYRRLAKEMKLEHLIFTGHLEKPSVAIDAFDLFLLLSTAHEGVSQASLQAAYLQKPLITTPVGGLSEVCIDGSTGLLVPPHNPQKVAEAVLELMGDASRRKSMGERAKKLVEENFTFEQMLDKMEELYQCVHIRRGAE